MSRLTRDGTAELVSRDQILRHARGQGNIHFPCSADHEQDWQPYPVDPYSAICDDYTYIHTVRRYFQHAYFIPIVGVGKRGAYYLIHGDLPRQHPFGTNYLEVYWSCAGGLSAVNAIGTQLRDPINSGLTRWRMAVLNK